MLAMSATFNMKWPAPPPEDKFVVLSEHCGAALAEDVAPLPTGMAQRSQLQTNGCGGQVGLQANKLRHGSFAYVQGTCAMKMGHGQSQ